MPVCLGAPVSVAILNVKRKGIPMRYEIALAAGLLLLAAGITPAHAIPMVYEFSSDATITFAGDLEAVSGDFTYDPSTTSISAASITLTGDTPYAGLYDSPIESDARGIFVRSGDPTVRLEVIFDGTLGLGADGLFNAFWFTGTSPSVDANGHVAGTAAPIPEPGSLVLLGSALFGLGSLRRRKKAAALSGRS
jgi:hypothetical protein